MERKEKLLLMECPPLGTIINSVSIRKNVDYPFIMDFPLDVINDSEDLIGAYFNVNDYTDNLDDFIDHLEQLDLFETLDEALNMIRFYKENGSDGFLDIKILAANGLVGLLFCTLANEAFHGNFSRR